MTNVENASLTSHPPLTPRSTRELPTFAPTELQRSNSNASHVSMPSVSARRMSRLSTGDALSNSALLSARGSERGKNRSISNASLSTRQRYNAVSPRSAVDVLQQWQVQGNAMKVYVRVRPFSEREIAQRLPAHSTVRIDSENPSLITILDPTREFRPVATYSFTRCFWSVFEKSASTLQAAKTMSEMRDTVDTYLHGGMNSAIRSHVQPSPTTPRTMDSARNRSSRDLARNESVPAYTGAGSNAALADANVSHPPYAGQEEVYRCIGKPILENTLDGYNGCVFAYGQTGSGKTFTMLGYAPRTAEIRAQRSRRESMALPNSSSVNVTTCEEIVSPASDSAAFERQVSPQVIALGSEDGDDVVDKASLDPNDLQGIIPRISADLFAGLRAKREKDASCSYRVEVMYYEIYNEKVFDLVRPQRNAELKIRHNPTSGPYVDGLTNKVVVNEEDVARVLRKGMQERHTAATKFNDRSSRSHAILSFNIVQVYLDGSDNTCKMQSKLNLVDLAGSERTGAAGAEGHELTDGIKINLSLTVLGRVIDCLADLSQNKSLTGPVPYRDSNLTWLLSDSLGGNSQTSMIATISPHMINFEEMRQTIRYASRAKQIMNRAVRNEDPQVRQIKLLMSEVERLNQLLAEAGGHEYTREYVKDLEKKLTTAERKLESRERMIGNLRAELERAGLPDPTQMEGYADIASPSHTSVSQKEDDELRKQLDLKELQITSMRTLLEKKNASDVQRLKELKEAKKKVRQTSKEAEVAARGAGDFVRKFQILLGFFAEQVLHTVKEKETTLFRSWSSSLSKQRNASQFVMQDLQQSHDAAIIQLEQRHTAELTAREQAYQSRLKDVLEENERQQQELLDKHRRELAEMEARAAQELREQDKALQRAHDEHCALLRAQGAREVEAARERLRSQLEEFQATAATLQRSLDARDKELRAVRNEMDRLGQSRDAEVQRLRSQIALAAVQREAELAEKDRQRHRVEDELRDLRRELAAAQEAMAVKEKEYQAQIREVVQQQEQLMKVADAIIADWENKTADKDAHIHELKALMYDKDYLNFRQKIRELDFMQQTDFDKKLKQLSEDDELEQARIRDLVRRADALHEEQRSDLQRLRRELRERITKARAVSSSAATSRTMTPQQSTLAADEAHMPAVVTSNNERSTVLQAT